MKLVERLIGRPVNLREKLHLKPGEVAGLDDQTVERLKHELGLTIIKAIPKEPDRELQEGPTYIVTTPRRKDGILPIPKKVLYRGRARNHVKALRDCFTRLSEPEPEPVTFKPNSLEVHGTIGPRDRGLWRLVLGPRYDASVYTEAGQYRDLFTGKRFPDRESAKEAAQRQMVLVEQGVSGVGLIERITGSLRWLKR